MAAKPRVRNRTRPVSERKNGKESTPRNPQGAGRPSLYSEEMADKICLELTKGRSLTKICEEDGMPERYTIVKWVLAKPDFAQRYDRARESQADYMDDLIRDVADASTGDTAAADRVKVDAYKWRAARLRPERYGDVKTLQHQGPKGGPVKVDLTQVAIDDLERLEAIFGKLASAASDDAEADQGGES